MKFSSRCLAAAVILAPSLLSLSSPISAAASAAENNDSSSSSSCTVSSSSTTTGIVESPFVSAKVTLHGQVLSVEETSSDFELEQVLGCCSHDDKATSEEEESSCTMLTGTIAPQPIGTIPQMTQEQSLQVLEDAKRAWNGGFGVWPQLSLRERIEAIEHFLEELATHREAIVVTLMWEIGKNRKDAEAEFDRTIQFVHSVMEVARTDSEFNAASWQTVGSTKAYVKRAAIGVLLALGPYNYPLNETYATLIPALLMGNVAIMKIPTVGGLSHLLTMDAFAKALPPGTMNFISGRGRATMPPLMASGSIDALAFIGGSKAADDLIKQHPHPHRLKVFLQLEAKNMAVSFL